MQKVEVDSSAPQNGSAPIKILLADDSEPVRRGIRRLLSTQVEIEVVGEASNFAQAIRMTSDLNPHVVILDLHMPDDISISAHEVKSHLNPASQVLAVSVWNDDDSRKLAESLGASIFLDKMNLANTLVPTIMQLKREGWAGA